MRIAALVSLLLVPMLAIADLPTFKIVAQGGRFTPERLTVKAGERVKLEIANRGNTPIEFENLQLRVEKVLAPGAASFVVLNPLKPGTYRFIDEFHADTARLDVMAQ
jgi:heme/copper-type cytochrome/quinol oxidase subunit 2